MKPDYAREQITEYLKPIYGFALKRCASLQDAEDLSQEIVLRAYRALLHKDDIQDVRRFIWTVAHNTLSNYYRNSQKQGAKISIEEFAEILPDNQDDLSSNLIMQETTSRLHHEIACLSKLQRQIIIAYYYENKKQHEIAEALDIPLGTVKWHLFEAKKNLKRGMETMRTINELKFNPVQFDFCTTGGRPGTKGSNSSFFRSALSQNIAYAVKNEAKTINEIAALLGVSPVYIADEAEYLEEYGFLMKQGQKYLSNLLLEEPDEELCRLQDEMYENAARLFANELYDELLKSGILDNPDIFGGDTRRLSLTEDEPKDTNFFLWSLIPYITAFSGQKPANGPVSFEEAATLRPDGGYNICQASLASSTIKPKYLNSMRQWSGPCWNAYNQLTLWQIDSEWSARRIDENYHMRAQHDLSLFSRWYYSDGADLTEEEYAYLVEHGYLQTSGPATGIYKVGCQCVAISGSETNEKLIAIGDAVRARLEDELNAFKAPYIKAVLHATPSHLIKMQSFVLQQLFGSDGWFIFYCLRELIANGRLKLPREEQKQALSTVIFAEK